VSTQISSGSFALEPNQFVIGHGMAYARSKTGSFDESKDAHI
jgi:hypothetical protein